MTRSARAGEEQGAAADGISACGIAAEEEYTPAGLCRIYNAVQVLQAIIHQVTAARGSVCQLQQQQQLLG